GGGTQMKKLVRYIMLFLLIYLLILTPFIQLVRLGRVRQDIQEISLTLQKLQEEIQKIHDVQEISLTLQKLQEEIEKIHDVQEISLTPQTFQQEIEKIEAKLTDIETRLNKIE